VTKVNTGLPAHTESVDGDTAEQQAGASTKTRVREAIVRSYNRIPRNRYF